MDERKRCRKSYEPMWNKDFVRKAFVCNDSGDYHTVPYRKFKYENQHKFSKGRQRKITDNFNIFNLASSNNRDLQNVSSSNIKNICPWSEEAAEEERKKQVSDTANELKNKLKMWNTVKSQKLEVGENKCYDRTCKVQCKDVKVLSKQGSELKNSEFNGMNNESIFQQLNQGHIQENNMDGKNFHKSRPELSHEKSTNNELLFRTSSHKSHIFSSMSKNRQKKIQQSLIGELMAIPKANLKKLLVNPQTHPKIEQKMAQIVQENKLILAQKFRSLAESKINQQGQFICSKFVDDMEDIIDSDLAVDLCQLPPELITQISDIFQLDCDCTLKEPGVQEKCSGNKNMNEYHDYKMALNFDENLDLRDSNTEDRISEYKIKEVFDVKVEPQTLGNAELNDLIKYKVIHNCHNLSSTENFHSTSDVECIRTNLHLSSQSSYMASTEDAVDDASNCCDIPKESNLYIVDKCFSNSCETLSSGKNCNAAGKLPDDLDESFYLTNEIKLEPEEENCIKKNFSDKFGGIKVRNTIAERCGSKPKGKVLHWKTNIAKAEIFNMKKFALEKTSKDESENIIQNVKKTSLENENPVFKSIETQTEINLIEADYSQPFLGQLSSENMENSLLREVKMIDDLLHRLNQRRFIIFLKLVGLESVSISCSLNKNNLKNSLIHTITNSDAKLLKGLSLGGNKKCETKRNLKRKNISNSLKISSKREYGKKNADDVNVINHVFGLNIQEPARSRKKLGSKLGNCKNHDREL